MSNKLISCPLLCGRTFKNSVLNKHITKECRKKVDTPINIQHTFYFNRINWVLVLKDVDIIITT